MRILGYETKQCNSRAQRSTTKAGQGVDEEPRAASEAACLSACLLVCLRRSSKSRDLGVVDAKVRADSLDSTVPLTREYGWTQVVNRRTLASLLLGGLSLSRSRSLRRGMNGEK